MLCNHFLPFRCCCRLEQPSRASHERPCPAGWVTPAEAAVLFTQLAQLQVGAPTTPVWLPE